MLLENRGFACIRTLGRFQVRVKAWTKAEWKNLKLFYRKIPIAFDLNLVERFWIDWKKVPIAYSILYLLSRIRFKIKVHSGIWFQTHQSPLTWKIDSVDFIKYCDFADHKLFSPGMVVKTGVVCEEYQILTRILDFHYLKFEWICKGTLLLMLQFA